MNSSIAVDFRFILAEQFHSLLFSNDEAVVFIGGGYDDPRYRARIAAVELGSSSTMIANSYLELTEFPIIFSMVRLPGTDFILAGGKGGVAMVYFDGQNFQTLGVFWDKGLGAVEELKINGATVYGIIGGTGSVQMAHFSAAFPNLASQFPALESQGTLVANESSQLSKLHWDPYVLPRKHLLIKILLIYCSLHQIIKHYLHHKTRH